MDLPDLINALSRFAAYPYPVDAVDVRQTHISVVFLAGPFAYKIKKPVHPEFLDFSTLSRRLHACQEEVRLNRRLAPEVYLDVVPVVRAGDGMRFEGEGEAIEWAVKMQRLPESATLRERLRRGEVEAGLVEALACRIADFHSRAEATERMKPFGQQAAVSRNIRDIFAQATPHVGTTVSSAVFERAKILGEAALTRLAPLIDQRAARGMTRDCHGDLHLDHIYTFPDRPPPADLVIIDCIEFNERFRFIDPVADMAFAAMDFAFHGRRDLARDFVNAYFQTSKDTEGRALLPLYTAYRATVRGTVEGFLLCEQEVPEAERAAALARAKGHWLLALGELEQPDRKPCLLLVAGLPGSGKSTLARELAECAGFSVIRSDEVRKELAGVPLHEETQTKLPQSCYTPEWNERTYAECLRRCGQLLFEGKRVLVDANFRQERLRRLFLDAADQWGVPGGFLHCHADPDTIRRRLEQRQGDASDADWTVYQQLAKSWETFGPATERVLGEVCTDGSPAEGVSRAVDVLRKLDLW